MAALTSCSTGSESVAPGIGSLAVSLEMQSRLLTPSGQVSETAVPYSIPSEEVRLTMTADEGDYAHTWDDFSRFPQATDYFAGGYVLTASAGYGDTEGYDRPYFTGTARVMVTEGVRTDATVPVNLGSVLFDGHVSAAEAGDITLGQIQIHTPGGVYHTVNAEADGDSYLCMRPGRTSVYASVSRGGDDPVRLEVMTLPHTLAGALYRLEVSVEGGDVPVLRMVCGDQDKSIRLTEQFFSAAPPTLSPSWSGTVTLPEGDISSEPLSVNVTPGGRPLAHLYLSTSSASLNEKSGYPVQVDLLDLTAEQREYFGRFGVIGALSPEKGGTVDFSHLVSELIYLTSDRAVSVFTLEAVDAAGVSAMPVALTVVTTPVEIEATVTGPAVMGVDRATLRVVCPSPSFPDHVAVEVPDDETGEYVSVNAAIERVDANTYDVSFHVPHGSKPVDVRILYCGELRATLTVERRQPGFHIEVDAFASTAGLRIVPDDPELTSVITSSVNVYVNGAEASLYQRYPDEGYVSIIGLMPSRRYTFKATMMSGVENPVFTPAITVETEAAHQLPNADFEEREKGITYTDLPSGGRYSQTTVEIFNWQHHVSHNQEVPKEWATNNAKTFCMASKNHNSWYMQPAVFQTRQFAFSKTYSVELVSVAFDPDGEPIPDYVQTGQPYLDYSPVVPHISYRAAGKLFLGKYSFNPATMEETYAEGIPWRTRPRSLNGYYRFLPSSANRSGSGLVRVELTGMADGREVVISSSEARLPLASDFTAFSVPLEYTMFGVKATGIKVMFSSSSMCGTIAEETFSIATDPDPLTASSVGGRLWIDNITLAY